MGTLGVMSEPCVLCGTDSVATCPSCNARVCNRHMVVEVARHDRGSEYLALIHPVGASAVNVGKEHVSLHIVGKDAEGREELHVLEEPADGQCIVNDYATAYKSGGPRCQRCRNRDGKAAGEAVARRIDEAAEAATRRLPQAEAELRAAAEPVNIARCILDGDDRIPLSAFHDAWVRLVDQRASEPSYELVAMERARGPFRGGYREVSRRPAWKGRDVSLYYPEFLDEAGSVWDGDWSHGDHELYAVPAGRAVRFRRDRTRTRHGGWVTVGMEVTEVRKVYDAEHPKQDDAETMQRAIRAIKHAVFESGLVGSGQGSGAEGT